MHTGDSRSHWWSGGKVDEVYFLLHNIYIYIYNAKLYNNDNGELYNIYETSNRGYFLAVNQQLLLLLWCGNIQQQQ